jgi:hypothetical protein
VLQRLHELPPTEPSDKKKSTFFLALQGVFEVHFEEGILLRAKAGYVYSEPIGKMHRGHNTHETLPYLCVAFCVTAPDRDHVTNVIKAF